jgi:hypothetical protein
MWVYKAKTYAYGAVSRYKARFVAKGCSQREGIDYTETFSLVIQLASLRVFFNIAAARDLELGGLDIDTAFLYAPIKEDVYIKQPLGFDDAPLTSVSRDGASTVLNSRHESLISCFATCSSPRGGVS